MVLEATCMGANTVKHPFIIACCAICLAWHWREAGSLLHDASMAVGMHAIIGYQPMTGYQPVLRVIGSSCILSAPFSGAGGPLLTTRAWPPKVLRLGPLPGPAAPRPACGHGCLHMRFILHVGSVPLAGTVAPRFPRAWLRDLRVLLYFLVLFFMASCPLAWGGWPPAGNAGMATQISCFSSWGLACPREPLLCVRPCSRHGTCRLGPFLPPWAAASCAAMPTTYAV